MDFNRFRDIILKNREHEDLVKKSLKEFYDRVQWDGDITKILREIGTKLEVFIIELPMNDGDFGAVFFETGANKYLLLNSNQPKNKMYFSFCHDIYHILNGTPDYINEKREVHFNQDYLLNDHECKANLFAANLLMPELEFKKMYKLYQADNINTKAVVAKLMNYFSSPFTAVLIRLFELGVLEKIEDVKDLLNYKNGEIETLFDSLWLDKDILKPTLKDEMGFVLDLLEKEGTNLIKNQLLSEYSYDLIMKGVRDLYAKIRLKQ